MGGDADHFWVGVVLIRTTYGLKLALPVVALSLGVLFASAASTVTDGVIAFLEQRIEKDPDDFVAVGKLGNAYLQKARESGEIDFYARAERLLRQVLLFTPDSYPIGTSLASALCSQHKFQEAITLTRKLILQEPGQSTAYGVLGDAWLETGDIPNAKRAYEKLAQMVPGLSTHGRLARLAWMEGKVAAAISNFDAALHFSNSPPEALAWARVQKGEILFRTGQTKRAQDEYSSALELFPDYYLALDHIAELRAAQGKFDEAAESFQQLAIGTQRPEYLQAAGDVLMAAKREDKAKLLYERALKAYLAATRGSNVHYFHHLAAFYADVLEDGVEAERWARRDLQVRQSIYAWDALAWALFWKKDYAGAEDAMKKALTLSTEDAHLFAHASSIFVRAGRIKEGQEFGRRANAANPNWQEFHLHR